MIAAAPLSSTLPSARFAALVLLIAWLPVLFFVDHWPPPAVLQVASPHETHSHAAVLSADQGPMDQGHLAQGHVDHGHGGAADGVAGTVVAAPLAAQPLYDAPFHALPAPNGRLRPLASATPIPPPPR